MPFVDLDALIEQRSGKLIPEMFAEQGEAEFRRLETVVLREVLAKRGQVIATGGGALIDSANRARALQRGLVVTLEAKPEVIVQRVGNSARPMLGSGDRTGRVRDLLAAREPAYAATHCRIDTSERTPEQVAEEVVRAWTQVRVELGERSYPIHIGRGALDALPRAVADAGHTRAVIVTHPALGRRFGAPLLSALKKEGVAATMLGVRAGEATKSLRSADRLYAAFLKAGLDRRGCVIALGGGVVGDLAGYAAATYLRGVAVYQAPTTLLAQVDSAIGGKTAVNHPAGKNLVGAFWQPRAVFCDLATLDRLPLAELRSGLAEVIKYGILFDQHFFAFCEEEMPALLEREPACLHYAVRRCAAFKARVVMRDERDEGGERALLNLGHTVGHALENVLGYGAIRHGEAVAIGTVVAARLAVKMGLFAPADLERITALYRAAGLPVSLPPVDRAALLAAVRRDKKMVGGKLRMVLPIAIGAAEVREVGEEALGAVLQ